MNVWVKCPKFGFDFGRSGMIVLFGEYSTSLNLSWIPVDIKKGRNRDPVRMRLSSYAQTAHSLFEHKNNACTVSKKRLTSYQALYLAHHPSVHPSSIMNNSTKVSSIRSRFERNSTSTHQSDLVRLASSSCSSSFKAFSRRASTGYAPTTTPTTATSTRTSSCMARHHHAKQSHNDFMNLDASFSYSSTADDSLACSVSGSSLSERMRSAWYMVEEDDESDNEE